MSRFNIAWFTAHDAREWNEPSWHATRWAHADNVLAMVQAMELLGRIDLLILADTYAIPDAYGGTMAPYLKYGLDGICHDPVPLIARLAAETSNIGFAATLNTSLYSAPQLARLVFTLDQMSRGRVGWNIVTGIKDRAAANYGAPLETHDSRYDQADDYVAKCQEFWNHWPRSPQGGPVLLQAGGSDRGRTFAATHANIVITHQNTVAAMKEFRQDIRRRAELAGRNPDDCKVLFTIKPVIGEDAEDAAAERNLLYERPTSSPEVGLLNLSSRTAVDFSDYPLDEPLSSIDLGDRTGQSQRGASLTHLAQHTSHDQDLTLRDVGRREAVKETYVFQGDAAAIATGMIEVMAEVGGDGLAVRGAMTPREVIPFVSQVVPELERLGARARSYSGGTLRDRFNATSPYPVKDGG